MALACDLTRARRSGQRQTPVPNAGVLLSRRFMNKILKGAKPADLPIEQSTRLDLVVNVKAADEIGLAVSPLFLARARQGHRVRQRRSASKSRQPCSCAPTR